LLSYDVVFFNKLFSLEEILFSLLLLFLSSKSALFLVFPLTEPVELVLLVLLSELFLFLFNVIPETSVTYDPT